MGEEYYDLLQVSPWASHDELRRAARKRRVEVHPDRCGDLDPAVMSKALELAQAVNAAADILTNPETRQLYDAARTELKDPFEGLGFADRNSMWFDPRDMGGDEASTWSGLFECAGDQQNPEFHGIQKKQEDELEVTEIFGVS